MEWTASTRTLMHELTSLLQLISPSHYNMDEGVDMRDLLDPIQLFITKARRELQLLCDGTSEVDRVTSYILQEIWLLKPDMVLLPMSLRSSSVVVLYLQSFVDSLNGLQGFKAHSVAPVKEEVEVLIRKLEFLKAFLPFLLKHCNVESAVFSKFWDHVTAVAKKTACCISFLYLADELDEEMADCISFMLQSIIPAKSAFAPVYVGVLKSLKSKMYVSPKLDVLTGDFINFILEELLSEQNSGSYLLVYKGSVQKLQNLLRFLVVYIFCNKPTLEFQYESFIVFDLVVEKLASFINSLGIRGKNEDLCKEFELALSNLVQKMEPVASVLIQTFIQVQNMDRGSQECDVYQVNCLGCINFISQNLQRLLEHRISSIASVEFQIEVVLIEIENFKPLLQGFEDRQGDCEEVLDVCNHMISLFQRFEYVVDMYMVEPSPVWYHPLDDVIRKIKLFKELVEFVHHIYKGKKDVPSNCRTLTSKPSTPFIHEAVVGLEDQIEILVARLIGRGSVCKIIPINGIPGIGKTTLAKRIYNDRRISDYFDIRAWCSVSPRQTADELLQDILVSIVDLSDVIYTSKERNSHELVHRRLFGRRYLIVLDGVWNSSIFDELFRCFPENRNGSVILFTSSQISEDPSFDEPLLVRLLTLEESWELLQVKYNHLRFCAQEECRKPRIPNENCPADVGMEIAVKCQGLPLAIVLVAGFLVNADDEKDWLTITKEAIFSETNLDVGDCQGIIELSYNNMPGHLRQCFLYFAAFPLSAEIPVSKLKWLWISEGFCTKR